MNDRTISIGFHTGEDTPYVVTHVLDVIACLYAIDPFRGFIAANVITNSLGYISLNAHLWDMRKNAQTRKLGEQANELGLALCDLGNSSNTIDRYNEWKKDETLAGRLETSPTPLPKVNGLCLLGVYKGMLQGQLASEFKQKPTMPQDILAQIATRQNDNVDTMIDSINRQALEKAGLSTSMIDAARVKRTAQTAEKDRVKTESETSAMIALFKITPIESFSNEHWEALPLWKQYQFLFMAYRQIMSGIGTAMADIERGYKAEEAQDRFDGLVALASEVRIELLTVSKSGEVIQAFEEDRLNAELYGIE